MDDKFHKTRDKFYREAYLKHRLVYGSCLDL